MTLGDKLRPIANQLMDDEWVEGFLRYVNFVDYLNETKLEVSRMANEGGPTPTSEQQRWLVRSYRPKP